MASVRLLRCVSIITLTSDSTIFHYQLEIGVAIERRRCSFVLSADYSGIKQTITSSNCSGKNKINTEDSNLR